MFKTTHLANMFIPTSHFTPLYACDMWRESEKNVAAALWRYWCKALHFYFDTHLFYIGAFKRNRIRDSHAICIGYLKIDPLNFPKRSDYNEGGFLIVYIYCPTVTLDKLFLSARAVCVLRLRFIVRCCSSPNDWLFKTWHVSSCEIQDRHPDRSLGMKLWLWQRR